VTHDEQSVPGRGGSAEDSRVLDRQFVTNLGPAGRFAYVPVAMSPSRYPDCRRWIESVFLPMGVRLIAMWTSLEGKTLDDLRAAGGLYIGGGDTAKLLREMRSSGFAGALSAFAQEDGPV
jgi:dipeptidase E